jgi:hypothetical protein
VRGPVCATIPTTSSVKVANDGAVNEGRNTCSTPASEAGTVNPGSIGESLETGDVNTPMLPSTHPEVTRPPRRVGLTPPKPRKSRDKATPEQINAVHLAWASAAA